MRTFTVSAALILLSNSALACTNVLLRYKGEAITICHFKGTNNYLSKNCRDVARCFFDGPVKLVHNPNQSPGFTLCYAIKGEPFFGEIEGLKEKIPLCKKGEFIADQEKIFYHYKARKAVE